MHCVNGQCKPLIPGSTQSSQLCDLQREFIRLQLIDSTFANSSGRQFWWKRYVTLGIEYDAIIVSTGLLLIIAGAHASTAAKEPSGCNIASTHERMSKIVPDRLSRPSATRSAIHGKVSRFSSDSLIDSRSHSLWGSAQWRCSTRCFASSAILIQGSRKSAARSGAPCSSTWMPPHIA